MNKELRVLVVEDSPQDQALINHELRKAGLQCRCRRVESREAFLHELEHHPPDIILSDHGVPGFDGFAALSEARNQCPNTPFIFVTGAPREEAVRRILLSGADDYVLKDHLNLLGPIIERAIRDAPAYTKRGAGREHPKDRLTRLEAASREMEKLTHAIALDLRLPLRHIESCSELLIKSAGTRLDQKGRNYLKTISEATHHMGRLIDHLVAFSRVGQAEMYQMRLSLNDIAREVIHELRHEAEGRDVEWIVGNLPEVTGDSVMLPQVIANLISNALKFTRTKEHARIEVGASESEYEHTIFVRDDGIGFDPHCASRLFGVFQRLHGTEFEGTGVSLANVRRIIERHGGRVWAEGADGKGAAFYFTLPKQP